MVVSENLASDKNYKIELVRKGFADRKVCYDDSKTVERIIEAYNKAKQIQLKSAPEYQVSNEWLPLYRQFMGGIMDSLATRNVDRAKEIYNNFMREPCSVGLHGLPVDMFKHYFGSDITRTYKRLFLSDTLHRYNLWLSLVGQTNKVNDLESPLIGNPYGYYFDGVFVKAGSDYLHYYATIIGRLIRSNNQKVVMELGGGYGGMAYYLMRDNADLTYVDFDLPENLALTSYYLLTAFPDKKIALYGELDLSSSNIKDYDAVLLPNFEIETMQNNSVDLIFNSYSLAEMSRETIVNYVSHFNRIADKFIFHVNHNRDSLVKADEFNIDQGKFELLYRAPALWNKGRNIDMDEFEYLYKSKKLAFNAI
ncbi:MAG: putative sugar O-methyltransferase [Geobacteraceae bacterium]|nr:putative sugar O-methyltransferase [Geobacteraceae bacterium]